MPLEVACPDVLLSRRHDPRDREFEFAVPATSRRSFSTPWQISRSPRR